MSENKNTKHKIRRDGDRALEFSGRVIGEGSDWTHNSTRWTTVTIFRTAGGKIVVKLHDRTQWQGESDTIRAESFRTVSEAISYLRNSHGDEYGYCGESYLSPEAQSAIESAGEEDSEFASAFTETVE
jgi:EXLDI family protein